MKALRKLLLSVERQMSRRHKQATILIVDSAVACLSFLLAVQMVYGSFWPEVQLLRLGALFPAIAMLGFMASLAAGLPRIKL